ncbi:MAG: glycosyltransferase [Bdellovibrionales bacterium]|nr:glycosyltransferase [Bdellovibrionales bacterium]
MGAVALTLSALACFFLLLAFTDLMAGARTLKLLNQVEPPADAEWPRVALIAAARNEERNIEAAVRSLLAQDYPNLEVILLNDRSTDSTGAILDSLRRQDLRLKVVGIHTLPAAWLGKCHALHVGAKSTDAEFLLFTDADVVMEPTTLRRAMAYVREHQLDHLALAPRLEMRGVLLRAFGAAFALFFNFYSRPWKARDSQSRDHVGIGAFNLVRKTAYDRAGGHEAIRLRPDDDMKLAKVIKRAGGRADCVVGTALVHVEWYASLGELVRGLEKNSFAGLNYSVLFLLLGSLSQLLLFIWPLVGLALSPHLSASCLLLNGLSVLILAVLYGSHLWILGVTLWAIPLFPVTVGLFLYILWRASLLTLKRGGIQWRGTFYPLRQLKDNIV